jgi:RNA polymerase sigma factor (sigma-70 family)
MAMTEAEVLAENGGLVATIAARYQGRGLDSDDLLQEGRIGLLKAVRNFDPERGVAFGTVAWSFISTEIRHALRIEGRRAREETLLDAPVGEDGVATLADILPDDGPGPEEQTLAEIAGALVRNAVPLLPVELREVIVLRYGLDGHAPRSLREIGLALGVSQTTVSSREERALDLLRRRLAA